MKNVVGNPVSGEAFFGRKDELSTLIRLIKDGNHVLIKSPRRVGKSSIVMEAGERLAAEYWQVIEIDVQDCKDESSFLSAINLAIEESPCVIESSGKERFQTALADLRRSLAGFKGAAAGVSIEIPEFESSWEDAALHLRGQFKKLADPESRVMVAMDELPIFLNKLKDLPNGESRVRQILDWLRALRILCKTNLPWVLCGSIGLDTFVKERELVGTINDFAEMQVGSLNRTDAEAMLSALADDADDVPELPSEVRAAILSRVGWLLPYYLQLMFHHLRSIPKHKRSEPYPSIADVDTAYQSAIKADSLAHWSSRLSDLLSGFEQSLAKKVLDAVCIVDDGVEKTLIFNRIIGTTPSEDFAGAEEKYNKVLAMLQNDGYVYNDNDRIVFRSFILRDHWRSRLNGSDIS